jgi:hypothetical protein
VVSFWLSNQNPICIHFLPVCAVCLAHIILDDLIQKLSKSESPFMLEYIFVDVPDAKFYITSIYGYCIK